MSDKSTSNRRVVNWSLAILGLIVFGICLFFYFSVVPKLYDLSTETSRIYQPVPTNMAELSMLEGNADLKFPPSAHEIYGTVSGFREVDTKVRFSMKASELPEFIKTTLCDKPLENMVPTTEQKKLMDYLGWWKAYQAKTLQRCSGKSKSADQIVFVDMTDPETYIIYVDDSTPITARNLPTQPKTETNP